jgi:AraC-like DNA-binding protein
MSSKSEKIKEPPFINFDLTSIEEGNFEIIEIKKGWSSSRNIPDFPHRHIFHELIWIKSGSEFHVVDYDTYRLNQNHILFIPKSSIHDYKPAPDTKGWKLIFAENFFTSAQYNIIKDFLIFIPCLAQKAIKLTAKEAKIVDSLFALIRSVRNIRQEQALIVNLLTYVEDCYLAKIKLPDSIFIKFLRLLNENLYIHKNILFYADKLNISCKTLNLIIKKSTGKTVKDYQHSRLLIEAKSKLRNPHLNIKEIAYSLGFFDALYFSRFFKKKTGFSPKIFREKFSLMSIT